MKPYVYLYFYFVGFRGRLISICRKQLILSLVIKVRRPNSIATVICSVTKFGKPTICYSTNQSLRLFSLRSDLELSGGFKGRGRPPPHRPNAFKNMKISPQYALFLRQIFKNFLRRGMPPPQTLPPIISLPLFPVSGSATARASCIRSVVG